MTGVIAAATVAHVPTMGRAEITPDFQQTLVAGERTLGAAIRRALKPDLWVIASTHWVATFDWLPTCQPVHEGHCVADEAPNLIPGIPYRYRGDPEFGGALFEEFGRANVPAARNDSPHYEWDYGTFVPLSHLDPQAEVAVVGIPTVLMADHAECMRAGAAVHATAKRLGRRVVFLASTAFSHILVRGRHNWPTPERMDADRRFIEQLKTGAIDDAVAGFSAYSRFTGAEMGGRVLATLLGVVQALKAEGRPLAGREFGEYAQSSASGNANVLVADPETLAKVH
jgi:3,4-dihydroxyphenylacetate 2,3-dioxygenase